MLKPVLLPDGDYMLPGGSILTNVHNPTLCAGRTCVVHDPTDHHMSEFRLLWRDDRGIFERICPHGVGHPDPDQFPYWDQFHMDYMAVHGCDGCCQNPDPDNAPSNPDSQNDS